MVPHLPSCESYPLRGFNCPNTEAPPNTCRTQSEHTSNTERTSNSLVCTQDHTSILWAVHVFPAHVQTRKLFVCVCLFAPKRAGQSKNSIKCQRFPYSGLIWPRASSYNAISSLRSFCVAWHAERLSWKYFGAEVSSLRKTGARRSADRKTNTHPGSPVKDKIWLELSSSSTVRLPDCSDVAPGTWFVHLSIMAILGKTVHGV